MTSKPPKPSPRDQAYADATGYAAGNTTKMGQLHTQYMTEAENPIENDDGIMGAGWLSLATHLHNPKKKPSYEALRTMDVPELHQLIKDDLMSPVEVAAQQVAEMDEILTPAKPLQSVKEFDQVIAKRVSAKPFEAIKGAGAIRMVIRLPDNVRRDLYLEPTFVKLLNCQFPDTQVQKDWLIEMVDKAGSDNLASRIRCELVDMLLAQNITLTNQGTQSE